MWRQPWMMIMKVMWEKEVPRIVPDLLLINPRSLIQLQIDCRSEKGKTNKIEKKQFLTRHEECSSERKTLIKIQCERSFHQKQWQRAKKQAAERSYFQQVDLSHAELHVVTYLNTKMFYSFYWKFISKHDGFVYFQNCFV